MVTKRQVHEAGHRRKFLAVVDKTPECVKAVKYAASRCSSIDADLVLVFVIQPADFQHWLNVEQVMRTEALADAEAELAKAADLVREWAGIHAQLVVREGTVTGEITNLIEEDPDIALLILAAGDSKDGPGPLVSSISGSSAAFPIPVTVVPATLTDQDIADLV